MTILYWICAAAGVAILLLSVVTDGLLDGVFDAFDVDADGPLSVQVVSAFVGAFGIVGLTAEAMSVPTVLSLVAAVVGGVVLGWVAWRLTRSLLGMATDATPASEDLVGLVGRVITPVGPTGVGEVLVRLGGQQTKLTAAASGELELGTEIRVVEVLSPTRVRVESESEFWGDTKEPDGSVNPEGES